MCYIWVLLGRPNCVATCPCSEFVLWNTSTLDRCQTLGEQLQGSWSWELWTIHVVVLTQNLSLGLSHCMSEYPYWLHAVFPTDSWMECAVIFSWQEETGIAGESTSQRTCVTADRTKAVCGCAGCVLTLQTQTEGSTAAGWDGHGQLVFCSKETGAGIVLPRHVVQQLQCKVCKHKQLEDVGTVLKWSQELVESPGKQNKEMLMAALVSFFLGMPTHLVTTHPTSLGSRVPWKWTVH